MEQAHSIVLSEEILRRIESLSVKSGLSEEAVVEKAVMQYAESLKKVSDSVPDSFKRSLPLYRG